MDAISIEQNGIPVYSEGFESGFRDVYLLRYGNPIVDTRFFGQGSGKSSSLVDSLRAGNNRTQVSIGSSNQQGFAAMFGSDLQLTGTVRDATSLRGISGAPISLEISDDLGRSFSPIGTTTADQFGNFTMVWSHWK